MKSVFIILLLHSYCVCWSCAEPLVRLDQGILNGTIQNSRNGRNYSAFLGIPYGKPPTGNSRFRSPVEADSWEGIRPADKFGSMCIQFLAGLILGEEDCLFLNVYTPLLQFDSPVENNTLLPVMVWFYGGSFTMGSGNMYGAEYFLDKDVLLVTMNYRLGIFGFLSTGDSEAPGNFGMKDQILSLRWVQKNIERFGGDPNRVTIFGESAGAASVSLHAISKSSDGLFQQYIIESGAALCPWAYQKRSNFFHYVRKIAAIVLCPLDSSKNLVDCLRRRDPRFLIYASEFIGGVTRIAQLSWTPTDEPESEDAFLTDSPKNLIEKNQMKDLPFMSGVNTDEALLFTGIFYSLNILYAPLKLLMMPFITYAAGYYFDFDNKTEVITSMEEFYFNNSINSGKRIEVLRSLTRLLTDAIYLYPELATLEKVTPKMNNSNYLYSFGYRGSFSITSLLLGGKNFGVGHADEILYLFPMNLGPFKLSNFIKKTATDEYVSELMIDFWTSFAMNGKPTSGKLDNPHIWQPYNTQNATHIQIGGIHNNTDPTVKLSNSIHPDRMKFWRKHYPIFH